MKPILPLIPILLIALSSCQMKTSFPAESTISFPGKIAVPGVKFSPRTYVCYRAITEITVDGDITGDEWGNAPWSVLFTDIEGENKPAPLYNTRVRMLWDDKYLYVAAELDEPHIWARLRQRDTVIFYDNDFEVFIDPDGDTHGYYEFEMNALNTVWDLLLTTPYRDYGKVIDAWDITGLQSGVKVYGTINDPSDEDSKWTLELAFPFEVLSEWGNMPVDGTQWRMNFSRVNWKTKIENGKYIKETDPVTGKPLPEFNWLWSPQGIINVHYPEMWGYVQFSTNNTGQETDFVINPDEQIKWELRLLYYAQRAFAEKNNRYTADITELKEYGYSPENTIPEVILTFSGYEARLPAASVSGSIIINHKGKVWLQQAK